MKSMIKCFGSISAVALSLAAAEAFSYEAGDIIVRGGIAHVSPNDDSSALELNGTSLENLGLGLPRSEAEVDTDSQIGLTISYMMTANWGVELLAATPFEHDIEASGLNLDAATTKHLPPTVSIVYYPLESGSDIQPYVGLGLNYTVFFDEDVDAELDNALDGLNVGVTGGADLELDDSIGLAVQVGVDYALDDHWFANASIRYIDIDTEATFKVPGLGKIKADVDIDPFVYMVSAGYKF